MRSDCRETAELAHPGAAIERPPSPAAARLAALATGPARVRVGQCELSTPQRLWLEVILQQLRRTLNSLLQRPVNLSVWDADTPPDSTANGGVGFTIVLRTASGARYGVALDRSITRAFTDALLSRQAGLRGYGDLTECECGVMEFLALTATDELLTAVPELADIALDALLGPSDVLPAACPTAANALALRCSVSGYEGVIWFSGYDWAAHADVTAPACAAFEVAQVGSANLALGVELGTVELWREEWRAAAAGDDLFLDASTLESFAMNARFITDCGWELAPAELQQTKPGFLRFRCAALCPCVSLFPSPAGRMALRVVLGWLPCSTESLAAWNACKSIDIPLDAAAPVHLYCGADLVATGEFVQIEDELAIRILALCAADPPSETDRPGDPECTTNECDSGAPQPAA